MYAHYEKDYVLSMLKVIIWARYLHCTCTYMYVHVHLHVRGGWRGREGMIFRRDQYFDSKSKHK